MSAYTQFGYPYATAASQLLMPGSQPSTATVAGAGGGTSCCETGRVVATDPVTGQAVCSCQYEPGRLAALNSYPRLSTGSSLHYSAAGYPSGEQAPYPSIGVDSSYFSSFSNPYGLKESGGADMGVYGGLSSTAGYGYSPYDPSLYGYGAPYDLASRRKNATRESTGTLKAWMNEHKKNPYPTKGEKIMLAIITKMTLTQVSTWFANARRRLKKENKMTWEPRNRTDDDDGDSDAEVAKSDDDTKPEREGSPTNPAEDRASPSAEESPQSPVKPRIWSLADMAMSGSSPASRLPPLGPAFLPSLPGGGKLLLPFHRPHLSLPYGRPESAIRVPLPPPPPPATARSPSPAGSGTGDSDRA